MGRLNSRFNINCDNQYEKAYAKILKLVTIREQSTSGLHKRLISDGFTEEVVIEALNDAVSKGIVDNARYAESYVRSAYASGKGLLGIQRELENDEIDSEVINQAINLQISDSSSSETDRAYQVLVQKPPRSKRPREAAFRKLIQKGYSSSVASSAARRWYEGL